VSTCAQHIIQAYYHFLQDVAELIFLNIAK